MQGDELPVVFCVDADELVAIVHTTQHASTTGVVVVVGGPQYRVGSHRQFVLLARALASAGIPVMRFDRRGAGDSGGAPRDFERIDADIKAAVDQLIATTGVARVVLWGLCDAASAILMYAHTDARVAGLVLLNPWVHSSAIEARVRFKTYYAGRLRSAEFWEKIRKFDIDLRDSISSLWRYARWATRFGRKRERRSYPPFIERMRQGWQTFNGPTLLVLSGDDLSAAEFRELTNDSPEWKALMTGKTIQIFELVEANHTFSRREWRAAVERATVSWIGQLERGET